MEIEGEEYLEPFKVTEILYILIRVWVTQGSEFVNAQWLVHLQFVHFSFCKFYLKKERATYK